MPKYDILWEAKQKTVTVPANQIVKISQSSIRLNELAARPFEDVKKVMLGYDVKQGVIAIREHDGNKNMKAYPVKRLMRPVGASIACKQFLETICGSGMISGKLPQDFPAEYVAQGKTTYIRLKETEADA